MQTGNAAIIGEGARLQARDRCLASASTLAVVLCSAAIAAGKVPAAALACWIAMSIGALLLRLHASRPFAAANASSAPVDRLQWFGAAASGLAAGAAGTLFLPLVDAPAQVALSLLACAGLCADIVDPGQRGRPFLLQAAGSIGQFALAWWRLDVPGSALVPAALLGFWGLAGLAASGVERLGRQIRSVAVENRRLVESLAIEHARARAADRARSAFVAATGHELRQPAAALALMAGLLRQRNADPALAPTVRGLERAAQAMNGLLEQWLELSRLEARPVALEIAPVNVDALLDDVVREIAPAATERRLTVRVEHCGYELDCDRQLTTQMLRHLADDALRHAGPGGVTLKALLGERLVLCVADTGSGIVPGRQARRVSEQRQPGDETCKRSSERSSERSNMRSSVCSGELGSGIGPAIVRRIAALHDIGIGVVSTPGQGRVVTLEFRSAACRPRARAASAPLDDRPRAPPAPPPSASFDAAFSRSGKRSHAGQLLLVEDDELLATAFLAWVREAGFRARRVSSGAQAIRALDDATALDVIVSDFRLPGGPDGLALLGFAGDRHPRALRVLVTGDTDPALERRVAGIGVTLLRKPVDPAMLRRLLDKAVS